MRVSELMSRNVATIAESETCHEAVERMCRAKVRHLPVLNGEGVLVGLVTDRDIRHRLFASGVYHRLGQVPVSTLLREARIRDVMSAPVLCTSSQSDVASVAEKMRKEKIGSLPVLEGGRLIGIVTEIDILRHICGADTCSEPELDIVVSFP